MKALKLLQLSANLHWYTVMIAYTGEEKLWVTAFAQNYPDRFRLEEID